MTQGTCQIDMTDKVACLYHNRMGRPSGYRRDRSVSWSVVQRRPNWHQSKVRVETDLIIPLSQISNHALTSLRLRQQTWARQGQEAHAAKQRDDCRQPHEGRITSG